MVISFFTDVVVQFLAIFARTAPFLLLGLLAAGVLRIYVPDAWLLRVLGGHQGRNVALGSILGVPLPICSCGIVPLSMALRRKGAGRGATMAFMVSTPETSADAVALTFGLMGPVMALARPAVALVTSLVAGLLIEVSDEERGRGRGGSAPDAPADPPPPTTPLPADAADHDGVETPVASGEGSGEEDGGSPPEKGDAGVRDAGRHMAEALRYGYLELLPEISVWLLIGLSLTAVVAVAIPDDALAMGRLGTGLPSMALAVAIGLPIYMCASGSTPLAAALIAKGLNPGAALVFLLVGPATNLASITMVRRFFGRRFTWIYVGSIVTVALLSGLLLNAALGALGWTILPRVGGGDPAAVTAVEVLGAIVLAGLMLFNGARGALRGGLSELREGSVLLTAIAHLVRRWRRPRRDLAAATGAVLALAWLGSSLVVVDPGEVGVVRRFGAVLGPPLLEEGLHLRWPWPVERVDVLDRDTARLVELGFRLDGTRRLRDGSVSQELDMITGDENLVDVTALIQYRVADPIAYLYGCDSPEQVVRQIGIAAVSEVLVHQPIDELLTTRRPAIQEMVLARTQELADAYGLGVRVEGFRLLDVHAPAPVHDAFRDVASAQENLVTSVNRAEGYRDSTLARARGEAAQTGASAAVHAARVVARARGEADAFTRLVAASAPARAQTRTRLHLETIERVLSGRRLVVRPGRSGGEFELWLLDGGEAADAGGDGGATIRVPVIPQADGDPASAEVRLQERSP